MPDIQEHYDVIVIGAGAAGLSAAIELSRSGKKVLVLEARDRAGGRIHTVSGPGNKSIVELGAEFIHGNLHRTLDLMKAAGLDKTSFGGSFWKHQDGIFEEAGEPVEMSEAVLQKLSLLGEDIPVADFLDQHLQGAQFKESRASIAKYVSGYAAADLSRASSFALRTDLQSADQDQYRPSTGYGPLIDFCVKELKAQSVPLLCGHPVERLEWQKGAVTIFAAGCTWKAAQVLITIPLGLLQNEAIGFEPIVPQVAEAAKALGFGNVIKVTLQFKTAFWEDPELTVGRDLGDLCFLFSNEVFPTWWRGDPAQPPSLTGWMAGNFADPYLETSDEELLQLAHQSLLRIFPIDKVFFQEQLVYSVVANWYQDPYSRGAYTFAVAGDGQARNLLREGIAGTIFFAGEALHSGPEIGTVEAALASGLETAGRMVRPS